MPSRWIRLNAAARKFCASPGEVGTGWARRVAAAALDELDGVEALAAAHSDPRGEHGPKRVELPEVDPALLGIAVVHVAERRGGEQPAGAGVGPVVLPGEVEVADGPGVAQGG